jgi:hypothetical protein
MGTSGVMSPFAKIDGLYFDPSDEPDEFYFNLIQDLKKKTSEEGKIFITCEYDNPRDFYNGLTKLKEFSDDNITISATSREGVYDIVINEDSDMDDQTKPQTVALAKKKKKKPEEETEENSEEEVSDESDSDTTESGE